VQFAPIPKTDYDCLLARHASAMDFAGHLRLWVVDAPGRPRLDIVAGG
jgi:hypothetical protein